ncbi:hypothetical protein IQ07DRAFT_592128 [Pyrenochaeta sp. DS3sAY3a]|nr:hypothetical protein IQ07DRAFT_592128 [Pyrenochaeta sp. DS3sAY3a]
MRPDRDENVIVNCENIRDGIDSSGKLVTAECSSAKTCRIGGCAFIKRDPYEVDYTGPYDRKSIMHYHSTSFSKDGKLKTIQGRPPFLDPEPSNQPTLIDAQKVCDLYSELCLSVCGDGKIGPGEQCDDGNNIDRDGCSADCQTIETANAQCGNGIVEPGEDCDEGSSNGTPGSTCSTDCKTSAPETPTAQCGNGIVEAGEECDAGSSNGVPGSTCSSQCKTITPDPETPGNNTCGVQTCDPRPGFNACHESTSCVQVEGSADTSRYLCACRNGFRASGDGQVGQARIPVELWPNQGGRVYVNPGMACNQLCDEWSLGVGGCTEVKAVDVCF